MFQFCKYISYLETKEIILMMPIAKDTDKTVSATYFFINTVCQQLNSH